MSFWVVVVVVALPPVLIPVKLYWNTEKPFLQSNRRNRKPEPLEPFHLQTVTEPNRGLPVVCKLQRVASSPLYVKIKRVVFSTLIAEVKSPVPYSPLQPPNLFPRRTMLPSPPPHPSSLPLSTLMDAKSRKSGVDSTQIPEGPGRIKNTTTY